MPTTTTPTGALLVALDQIHVPVNVRELDQAHVDALAGSIALQGMLVPVVLTHAEITGDGVSCWSPAFTASRPPTSSS